jgi:hypothetical protein
MVLLPRFLQTETVRFNICQLCSLIPMTEKNSAFIALSMVTLEYTFLIIFIVLRWGLVTGTTIGV